MSNNLSVEIDRSRPALVLSRRIAIGRDPDGTGSAHREPSGCLIFAAPSASVSTKARGLPPLPQLRRCSSLPVLAWLVVVFGVKRVLIGPVIIYTASSLIIPFVRNFEVLLALHAIRAIMLGVFVGATIMTAFRNLDRKYWIVALAFYVVRVPFAQNLGLYTAGSYSQTIGWQWLYWQGCNCRPGDRFARMVRCQIDKDG